MAVTRIYEQAASATPVSSTSATYQDALSLTIPTARFSGGATTWLILFQSEHCQTTNNSTDGDARFFDSTNSIVLAENRKEPYTQTSDIEWFSFSGCAYVSIASGAPDQVFKLQYCAESAGNSVQMRNMAIYAMQLAGNDVGAAALSDTTSTSTTWTTKATATAPATMTGDIFFTATVKCATNTTTPMGLRVLLPDGSTVRYLFSFAIEDTGNFYCLSGWIPNVSFTSSQTALLQFSRPSGTGTVACGLAHIVVLDAGAAGFDHVYQTADYTARSTASTSLVSRNAADETTFTPAGAVDHLLLGSANLNRSTNTTRSAVSMELPASTVVMAPQWRGALGGVSNFISFRYVANMAVSSVTLTPKMKSVEAGTTNSDWAATGAYQLVPATTDTPANPIKLALVVTTFAPTVVVDNILTPAVKALTVTMQTPAVGTQLTPGVKALTVTTFAPAIGTELTPAVKALTVATFAPTVAATANVAVTPTTLALTTATFAPTILIGVTVSPTTLALTTATFAPTVATPTAVTPTTLALTTTKFAPTVAVDTPLTPAVKALTTATFAPTVTVGAVCTPGVLALTTATFAPTVAATANVAVTPTTLALTTATFAPGVAVGGNQAVTPTTLALATATFAPTVALSDNKAVTPSTLALVVTTFAPSLSGNTTVTPAVKALTVATFAPTVATPVALSPAPLALTTGTFAPTVTVSNNAVLTPILLALIVTLYAPTVTVQGPETAIAYWPLLRWHERGAVTYAQPAVERNTEPPKAVYGEPELDRWRQRP